MKRLLTLLPFGISLILFSSCADLFENRISMDTSTAVGTLSELLADKEEITVLTAPSQIFVSEGQYNSKIKITWSEVTGATSYRLERAIVTEANADSTFTPPEESEYETIQKYVYNTTYTDTILSSPTYSNDEYNYGYFYRVSAENPRKKYDSSEYTTSTAACLFAPATNVKASLGESTDSIRITWDKTKNATSYSLYRSESSDGTTASLIGTIAANQNWYTNSIPEEKQGVDFYYSVIATNSLGNSSVSSSLALGYSLTAGAPARVTGVTIDNSRGTTTDSIKIKWTAVTGTDIKYAVYRTSSVDSSYTLLSSSETGTTYTDTKNIKPNIYYYYQIQAWSLDSETGEKLKGAFSESSLTDASPAEGYILSAPSNISVTKDNGSSQCTIVFSAALGSKDCPDDSGLSSSYNTYSYNVYSCDSETGTYTLLTSITPVNASNGYYTCSVNGANFYKLTTVNGSTESALSSVTAPAPYAAENVIATKAAYIESVTDDDTNANDNGVHAVKITWTEPSGGAAGGYYVYRSTKPSSAFRKITDEPVTNLYYIDSNETAKAGVYYYYRVLSLNSLKQGANYSQSVIGYGALTADQYMREYNNTVKASQKKLTLMHKSADTDKLGSETINGAISGSLSYNAQIAGLGAEITMHYTNYADFYINSDSSLGVYFLLNGNTDTTSNMSGNGNMHESVTCTGMYPGTVNYNNLEIKGGAAGGGSYGITRNGFSSEVQVSWLIGEE